MIQCILGRKRKLILPNGNEHQAVYAIVNLEDIKASHNEITFSDTIGYPLNANYGNLNDRNYKDDIAAQNNVRKIAENLNPEGLVSLSSTPAGTPIINRDGIVVSGNNRVMSLKLAEKQFPERYKAYKLQLAEDIEAFGFEGKLSTAIISEDKFFNTVPLPGSSYNNPLQMVLVNPVLVRIDESLPEKLTTEDLAQFNQDTKKGERPVDRAIKLSNILLENEKCRNVILSIVDGYDTFSELYSANGRTDRKRLVDNFVQCGLIPEAQLPTYFDNGEFTEGGKEYIESLLSAMILTPDALKVSNAEGVKNLRRIVIGSLPLLITNANLKQGSLKENISQAIIAQYKINQVGDFSDYMRGQTLFNEEKIDNKSLAINRLLNKGRNEFKNAIRRYNDSVRENEGQSLFATEKLTPEQIFDLTIYSLVDESDKKLMGIGKPEEKSITDNKTTTMLTDESVTEIEEVIPESKPMDWFVNDNYFRDNPDHILGEAYEASGRFGKVTKYRGDISAVSRIDVSLNFIGNETALNKPFISSGTDQNISAEILVPEVADFVESVIKKSDAQVGEKITRKAKAKKVTEDDEAIEGEIIQLQTFEDVWRTYNPGITRDELEVYVWYKTQIGRPLSRQWINLIHPGEYTEHLQRTQHYNVGEEDIKGWVERGLVFYYEGKLQPAPIYLSGNMYDKKMQLDRDKDDIIEKYGEHIYEKQVQEFNQAWRGVYDKRLLITDADDSLVVLPISKLANEFQIERIAEMLEDTNFFVKKTTAAGNPNYGKPDWNVEAGLGDSYQDNKKRETFEKLSLTDAFVYWMIKYRPDLAKPITYLEIANHYCFQKPIRMPANMDEGMAKTQREKIKSSTQSEGQRLFKIFLSTQLETNDKVRLETQWNTDFNSHLSINLNKIPVAFTMCRYCKGAFEELRAEKREAVAFAMEAGSSINAYGVGVGKTNSSIFIISSFLDAGYCKRPVVCPPNQVYKQFISEIKTFAPHIPVIEGYNLSDGYAENLKDAEGKISQVPEGTITIITYEGLEMIGFSQATQDHILSGLYAILSQDTVKPKSEKQEESFYQKLLTLVGRGLSGTMFDIENFGFDFICYDEAHKMKKVFTTVKGEVKESDTGKESRGKNPYVITSGSPSSIALKGFMLNYYIQSNHDGANILLLTATPFTNSPLEIFSMLSMVAYEQLRDTNLNNIKNFFDTYVATSTELVINSRLKPQFKQTIRGYNNLISLQTLIRKYINYKSGEEANVQRPNKYVIPYTKKIENGIVVNLPEDEKVECYIGMTDKQTRFYEEILEYIESGEMPVSMEAMEEGDEDEDSIKDNDAEVLDESTLSEDEKIGVRIIKGITWGRNVALSPYLYPNAKMGKPTYKQYIETSPKLMYTMLCIKSVKEYHESKGQEVSGQIIYMDRGIEYFGLIKEYLVKVIGYKEHEIGIIKSGLPKNGVTSKEYVKNLFNGEIYNEQTKMFVGVPYEQRLKIIIGSSTMKEGMNLQRYTTTLYDLFVDWNPTDFLQLQGRFWRQGNTYGSVRVVLPLVIDSMDIFMFQKLSEKTSRLNTIWATDGKTNILSLDEFNPEDLKYDLIRDVNTIAHLQSIEAVAKLENEILGYKRDFDTVESIRKDVAAINNYFSKALEFATTYRSFDSSNDKLTDARKIVNLINDVFKTQKDKKGHKMVGSWEKDISRQRGGETWNEFQKRIEEVAKKKYSPLDMPSKPYWFADFALAVRDLERAMTNFIKQKNIQGFELDSENKALGKYLNGVDEVIATADEKKKYLASDEYKKELAQAVVEKRIANKVEFKPLSQVVADFGRLNYLLSDKKVKISNAERYGSCPPMNQEGERLIDSDALAYLDECVASAGQTKDLYFRDGQYTPERQELHNQIINDLFENVKCVTKGEPIAVFTGGSPASGKTTYLKKVAPQILTDDVFKLDADGIRATLPEYQGWNANSTHRETQDIVNQILENIGNTSCRYDFVYDGTMNSASKYFNLINKVKALGYKTFIVFFDIPYGVARQRALQRYKKSGRYVPMEVIDDFFKVIPDHNGLTMGQYALDQLKSIVDGYIVIDGITGQIISKGGEEMPKIRVYEGQARREAKNKELNIPTQLPDVTARPIKKIVKAITIPEPEIVPEPQKQEPTREDILDFMAGLKILVDLGDKEAEETLEGLKLVV